MTRLFLRPAFTAAFVAVMVIVEVVAPLTIFAVVPLLATCDIPFTVTAGVTTLVAVLSATIAASFHFVIVPAKIFATVVDDK